MARQISRDPFARETLMSERVYHTPGCDWCSQSHSTRDHMRSFNFRYFVETDGGRRHDIHGQFCSVSCMRSYHS